MSPIQLQQLQQAYPEADSTTLYWLQHKKIIDEIETKREAERQGREAARAFNAAFEKELEKLFKKQTKGFSIVSVGESFYFFTLHSQFLVKESQND